MNDFTKESHKTHAKKTIERWGQYYDSLDELKAWEEYIKKDDIGESLSIGFRGSDE